MGVRIKKMVSVVFVFKNEKFQKKKEKKKEKFQLVFFFFFFFERTLHIQNKLVILVLE